MKNQTKTRAPAKSAKFPLLGYRPDIDGLRAVAVLSVLGFHAFPDQVRGGFAGVDVFFVISGFLISNQILHRLERGNFTLAGFYARRIRRIFPALALLLLACFVLGWFALFAGEFAQLGKHIAAGAGFLSNFLLWNESGYFDTSSKLKPLLHLWSLGVEEQFYLLWPVTLLLAFRFRWKVLPLVIAILVVSLGFNLYYVNHDASGAFYLPFSRFWELMAGAVLASTLPASQAQRRKHSVWAAAAGLLLVLLAFAVLRESMLYPGAWAILPTLGAALVLFAGPDSWINRHILANRALVLIGLISYPLYLWHWSILSFGEIVESGVLPIKFRLYAILASFVLSFLTYWLVERPIRFGKKTPVVVAAITMVLAVAGGLGWTAFTTRGIESRAANHSGNFARDIAVPSSTYTSDGSCLAMDLQQIKNEVCISAKRPEVMVVGDSHAIALNSAPFMGQSSVRTLLIAANSCLPFVDYVSRSAFEKRDDKICVDVAWQILGAARNHPEMKNVVLLTRGPIYFSGEAFGIEREDSTRDGWVIDPMKEGDGATNPERFLNGYSRLVSALEGYGRSVTFVIDVPELGLDPRTCVPNRPLAFSPRAVSPCTIPRAVVNARQAEYRKLVKSLSIAHPSLRIFDPLPLFCDDQACHAKDATHLFYYDNNHLSIEGSERVWNALLPVLQ